MHKPTKTSNNAQISFPALDDYTSYLAGILGRSELTIKEYRYDLIMFFRFLLQQRGLVPAATKWEEIDLKSIDVVFLNSITLRDLYSFIGWLTQNKKASTANRSRKIATLRSFFKYQHSKAKILKTNPAAELESPKQLKKQPRYLELNDSKAILKAAANNQSKLSKRDYCILTLFLNCGLRLAELCSIDLDDIREDSLRVLGKGGKERTVYLNGACTHAILNYLEERPKVSGKDERALFISRQGNRLSRQAVQLLVKNYIRISGLDASKYSTHKLRHTAATLLFKYGKVDIRLLQQILGHASVSTTEIYTHIDSEILHTAVEQNPLADEREE